METRKVASVKKTKQPGENISLKTKKTEDPLVMDWINAQTNLMDSLRYLIEREIVSNGVRNLQAFIPAERNVWGACASAAAGALDAAPGTGRATPAERARAQAPEPERASNPPSGRETAASPSAENSLGLREMRAGAAEASAGRGAPTAIVKPADDEIDDDDIEAWL